MKAKQMCEKPQRLCSSFLSRAFGVEKDGDAFLRRCGRSGFGHRALLCAGGEAELARATPARPSEAVALAHGRDPIELVLARALGAEWLDRYMREWRSVSLEIDGADLLAAGVPQGPRLGRGLEVALRRKLERNPSAPALITNEPAVGYRLTLPAR